MVKRISSDYISHGAMQQPVEIHTDRQMYTPATWMTVAIQ